MSNTVVDQVVVDGLAVLKIVKHCREGLPNLVSGALLGLDQRGVLEITHSFPGISTASADGGPAAEANAEDDQQYQLDMMTSLREVNVDNNRVGWYQSMFYGNFNNFQRIKKFHFWNRYYTVPAPSNHWVLIAITVHLYAR